MKTKVGVTGNIITRADEKIVETETVKTGTGPILPMKKENMTPTPKTPPPWVGAVLPPLDLITS